MATQLTNRKFIYFKHLANFENLIQTQPGSILDSQIVFIEDARKIWTHGTYYTLDERISQAMCEKLEALLNVDTDNISKLDEVQFILAGPTIDRPVSTQENPLLTGLGYLDTDLGKEIWWNGTTWVDAEGTDADMLHRGDLQERPDADEVNIGFPYLEESSGQLYIADGSKYIPIIPSWTYLKDSDGTIDHRQLILQDASDELHITISCENIATKSVYEEGDIIFCTLKIINDSSYNVPITDLDLTCSDESISFDGTANVVLDGQFVQWLALAEVTAQDISEGSKTFQVTCSGSNILDLPITVSSDPITIDLSGTNG